MQGHLLAKRADARATFQPGVDLDCLCFETSPSSFAARNSRVSDCLGISIPASVPCRERLSRLAASSVSEIRRRGLEVPIVRGVPSRSVPLKRSGQLRETGKYGKRESEKRPSAAQARQKVSRYPSGVVNAINVLAMGASQCRAVGAITGFMRVARKCDNGSYVVGSGNAVDPLRALFVGSRPTTPEWSENGK